MKEDSRESGPSLFGGDFNHGGFQSNGKNETFIRGKQQIALEKSTLLMHTASIFLHPSIMTKRVLFLVRIVTFYPC